MRKNTILLSRVKANQKTKAIREDMSEIASTINENIEKGNFYVEFKFLSDEQMAVLKKHGYLIERRFIQGKLDGELDPFRVLWVSK